MFQYYANKSVFDINTLERYACGFPVHENVTSLNGKWRFKFYKHLAEIPAQFGKEGFDYSDFDTVPVPFEWQMLGYDIPLYANIQYPYAVSMNPLRIPYIHASKNTAGLYVKEFTLCSVPEELHLYFGGINSCGEIYLNGNFVGYSENTFGCQEYDVTSFIRKGKNILSVGVFRYCTGSYLEDQDMWRLSGIFRDVFLVEYPKDKIRDAYSACSFANDYKKAVFTTNIYTDTTEENTIVLELTDGDEKVVFKEEAPAEQAVEISTEIKKPALWSHEKPNLYTVKITLMRKKKILDERKYAFGFREIKIQPFENGRGPFVLLNGVPVKFRGVNRHEFHCERGHALTKEIIRSDLELCKRNNITAIRTSHYPNNPYFYEVCDEIGILVICENNLETHGLSNILPKNSPYWEKQCVFRAVNMVKTFRNHPCIVSWSLGNEAGFGKTFVHMKEAILALDKTRFIHYEGDYTAKVSDVMSEMYTHQEEMRTIGECKKNHVHGKSMAKPLGQSLKPAEYRNLPFMQCEYSHCMGNSLGNFSDYWKDYKRYDRLAGGFIWDFVDQSIKVTDPDGTVRWTYGGDFGDEPNFGTFCYNGILRADRTPNPAFYEVKKQYQMVDFAWSGNTLTLKNNHMFTDLKGYILQTSFLADGNLFEEQSLKLPSVPPQTEYALDLEIPEHSGEISVLFEVKLSKKELVRQAKDTIAFEQFLVKPYDFVLQPLQGKADFHEGNWEITIFTEKNKFIFEKKTGAITSIAVDDHEKLKAPILPNFCRPTIDNDNYKVTPKIVSELIMRVNKFFHAEHTLRPKNIEVYKENDIVVIKTDWKYRFAKKLQTRYLFSENGVDMEMEIIPNTALIRYGFTFGTMEKVREIDFYGKGKQECYCDRDTGAVLREYKGIAEDFTHEYLYPQENGNHTETRFLHLGDDFLLLAKDKPFEFSVRPYTIHKLEAAQHYHELVKDKYYTVTIDGKQRGVGGDGTGFAFLKPQYTIPAGKKYILKYRMIVK